MYIVSKANEPTISILIQNWILIQIQLLFSFYKKGKWKFFKLNFQMEKCCE